MDQRHRRRQERIKTKCCARHSDDFHRPTLDFAESIFPHVANQRLAHSSAVERSQINLLQSNSKEVGDRCDRFVPRASLIQDAVHAWFAWLGRPLLSHSVVLRRPQKTEGHCSASWTARAERCFAFRFSQIVLNRGKSCEIVATNPQPGIA